MSSSTPSMQFRVTLGLALALALGLAASPGFAQNASTYAGVTLALTSTDSECASVSPDPVTIYTPGQNPRAVEWTVTSKDPDQTWKLEYASGKPGASAPGFGSAYWIPCGTTDSVQSALASTAGNWVYRVKVYECVGGEPSGDPICTVDPTVIIEEPPGGAR